jgi:uncharacterized protein (TIGR02266 family)
VTKILLLDDADLFLEFEHSFLRRSDCELLTAPTDEDLLEKVRRDRPNVVLLDVPRGRDGLGVCRAIKDDPDTKSTPVIFVSMPVEHERCMAAGADGFVSRPASRGRLLDALRRFVPAVERACYRLPVTLRVEYQSRKGDGVGFTKDLGPEGLFLKTRDDFDTEDALDLTLTLPVPAPRPIHAGGRVVRTVAARPDSQVVAGVGVAFTRISATDKVEVTRFVRERAGEDA